MEQRIQVENLSELHPAVNFANFTTASQGTSWGPRIIPDCQFIHVVAGMANIVLNGENKTLLAGDCVFYGANSPHQITVPQNQTFTFYSLHFSWDRDSAEPIHPLPQIRECGMRDLETPAVTYRIALNNYGTVNMPHYFIFPQMENLLASITEEYNRAAPGYALMMRGLLHQLLADILRSFIDQRLQESPHNQKIASVLEAMRQDPARNWSMKQLAGISGYHPTYFAALFKDVMGHAPKHFLVLERIRLAKSLLSELDSVEEVAERLRYSSLHYFSRHFKAVTGFTPSEFKKRSAFL